MPTAAVKSGEIYFEESGSGELIVLMAGLGHGAAYYEKTVPLLAGLGRTVAIDPRGVGRSTSKTESYSVEAWAADVVELMDRLGAARAHLVGSSLGACVALQAAVDHPDARVPLRADREPYRRVRTSRRSRLRPYHVHRAPRGDGGHHQDFPGQGHPVAGLPLNSTRQSAARRAESHVRGGSRAVEWRWQRRVATAIRIKQPRSYLQGLWKRNVVTVWWPANRYRCTAKGCG